MKRLIFLCAFLTVALLVEACYLVLRDKVLQREKAISASLKSLRPGIKKKEGGGILRVNLLSNNAVIHNVLSALPFTRALDTWLEQAHVQILLDRFLLFVTLSCLGTATLALYVTHSLLFGLFGWLAGGFLPWFYVIYTKRRRMAKLSEQMPEALDTIVRSLRAGYSMAAAFEVVSQELPPPISVEFSKIKEENKLGVSMKESMESFLKRCDNMDVKLFVTSVLIQWEIGGNLTEILENLSYTIRERFKLRGHIKALTAEGRLSGLVLGLVPLVVGIGLYYMTPSYLEPFFTTTLGKIFMGTAIGLVVLGWLIIKKIVTVEI